MARSLSSLLAREFLQSSHEQLEWQNPRELKHTQYLFGNNKLITNQPTNDERIIRPTS